MLDVIYDGATVRLVLNHPPVNVLDSDLFVRVQEVISTLHDRATTVRFVVLESALPERFSAGVSVPEHAPDRAPNMIRTFHRLLRDWVDLPQVTIAKVDGYALGGAAEWLLLTDFVIASDRSTFGFPEIQLAFYPPVALAFLADRVGYHRAVAMILEGQRFAAADWWNMGLLTRVVPATELEDAVRQLVERLAGYSRTVLGLTVQLLRRHHVRAHWARLESLETTFIDELLSYADPAEGVRAFIEKRAPRWLP